MRIEVTRPFYLDGAAREIGYQAEVDDRFGRELIHNGKAKPAPAVVSATPAEKKPARKEKHEPV